MVPGKREFATRSQVPEVERIPDAGVDDRTGGLQHGIEKAKERAIERFTKSFHKRSISAGANSERLHENCNEDVRHLSKNEHYLRSAHPRISQSEATNMAISDNPGEISDIAELSSLFPQLEIIALIGEGGMGAVYKARQKKLDRLIALKVIRQNVTGVPFFADRFEREARTLARLSHPKIVGIHDFGEVDTRSSGHRKSNHSTLYFLMMEYVDGENLRHLIDSGTLSPELAVSLIRQICEPLEYAHGEGIVHRDIKPENILIDSSGRVRIADFGLAKLVTTSAKELTLTKTLQIVGTPRYMAPEQMEGSRDVDQRADIFSLGIVFYEMLTGTTPAGHFEPPSMKSGAHPDLDEIVLRAISSDPQRRYQSVSELQDALTNLESAPADGTPERPALALFQSGISTILDREIVGTWRILTGREISKSVPPADAGRSRPFLLLLILVVAAVSMVAFPWMTKIRQFPNTAAELRGADLTAANGAALIIGLCGMTWLVTSAAAKQHLAVTGPLCYLSCCSVLLIVLSFAEAEHRFSLSFAETEHRFSAIEALPGYWITIALFVTIACILTAWFRQSLTAWLQRTQAGDFADFVRVPVAMAESRQLPNVCMVCGRTANERVKATVNFWEHPLLMLFGIMFAGPIGLLIGIASRKQTHLALPFCQHHKSHLDSLAAAAGIGWLLPILTGGVGFLVGYLPTYTLPQTHPIALLGLFVGALIGLVAYVAALVWLSSHRVGFQQKAKHEVLFVRVSSKFAEATEAALRKHS